MLTSVEPNQIVPIQDMDLIHSTLSKEIPPLQIHYSVPTQEASSIPIPSPTAALSSKLDGSTFPLSPFKDSEYSHGTEEGIETSLVVEEDKEEFEIWSSESSYLGGSDWEKDLDIQAIQIEKEDCKSENLSDRKRVKKEKVSNSKVTLRLKKRSFIKSRSVKARESSSIFEVL